MVAISNCNVSTTLTTFKRGLLLDGALYVSLTKYASITMEDAMLKANTEIKWEEDKERRLTATLPNRLDTTKRLQYDRGDKKDGSRASYDKKYDDKSRSDTQNYSSDRRYAMVHQAEENN